MDIFILMLELLIKEDSLSQDDLKQKLKEIPRFPANYEDKHFEALLHDRLHFRQVENITAQTDDDKYKITPEGVYKVSDSGIDQLGDILSVKILDILKYKPGITIETIKNRIKIRLGLSAWDYDFATPHIQACLEKKEIISKSDDVENHYVLSNDLTYKITDLGEDIIEEHIRKTGMRMTTPPK